LKASWLKRYCLKQPWLRGLSLSTLFVVVCLAGWYVWGTKLSPEKLPTPADKLNYLEEQGASDFVLPTLEGKVVRLSDFKGKVIVLNFWATWCAPCVTEFPSMVRMANRLKNEVVLITVAADERKDDVVAFINSFNGRAPNIFHLYDPTTVVAKQFGTDKLPETYIFRSDLKLAKKVLSSLEWDKDEVLTYLKSLH
jgi:thiol-disulfide isomerase/thioredoxin